MPAAPFPRLLGDIGGTNARFALQRADGSPLEAIATLPGAGHATLLDAARAYLATCGATPRSAAIGVATPVLGDFIAFTNSPWSFSASDLQKALGLDRLLVLNDFEALAWSLPAIAPADLHAVGSGTAVAGAPLALIGPGTGTGVSSLVPLAAGGFVPVSGEGGHVTLGGANPREDAVIAALRDRFGHASAERALSGQGLENLHAALALLDGAAAPALDAATVTARALQGADARCAETVQLFFGLLGSVAGNLALTLGARGGVYIGGGIVPRLLPLLQGSSLRERFEAKGRFRGYLAKIPLFVITADPSPALLGAARALDAAG